MKNNFMNRQKLAINLENKGGQQDAQNAMNVRKKGGGPTQVLMNRRIATKVSIFEHKNFFLHGNCSYFQKYSN